MASIPAPAPSAPGPPNADKLTLAKEFAAQLAKGIKAIALYRHNPSNYGTYLEKVGKALGAYHARFGPLSLRVESGCLSLGKEPVFVPEDGGDNLPYRFYRDGIRSLVFRPDLSGQELVQFVMIALPDHNRTEDLLALMWKASFQHLDYVAVEGFTAGTSSPEEVQVEVDQLVEFLYARLRSGSPDSLGFARLSLDDLDAQLEGVDQMRGLAITGVAVADDLKAKSQAELERDENELVDTAVRGILQGISHGIITDPELLKEVLGQLLDALLLEEQYRGIGRLHASLKSLGQVAARSELAKKLDEALVLKMGEVSSLRQLASLLQKGLPTQLAEIKAYLDVLTVDAIPALVEALDVIELPELRQLFVEALVRLAQKTKDPAPFASRLASEKSQTVRDMINVIERCDFPDKRRYHAMAMANHNPVVRQGVLAQLGNGRSAAAVAMLTSAFNDGASLVRIQAAKSLAQCSPEQALRAITGAIKTPEFENREFNEREAFYAALGMTCLPGAYAALVELLHRKSLFAKKKVHEGKLCAIAGLGAMATLDSFKALSSAAQDKAHDDETRAAAKVAMAAVRHQLSGGKGPTT